MKKVAIVLVLTFIFVAFANARPITAIDTEANDCIPEFVRSEDGEKAESYSRIKSFEKDLNTIAYVDGGYVSLRLYDSPVKYIDENGKIKDKSVKISENNIFSKYRYSVEGNDTKQFFPVNITDGIKIANKYGTLIMRPEVVGTYKAKKAKDNNTVEYAGVFGSETSIVYTPQIDCLKEDIVLESYNGNNTFSFIVATEGVTLKVVDERVCAVNEDGQNIYYLKDIVSYDSSGLSSIGSVILENLEECLYRIKVIVSESFLQSSDTMYPVRIDPTFAFSPVSSRVKQILKPFETAVVTENIINPIPVYRNTNGGISVAYIRIPEISNYMMIYGFSIASVSSVKMYLYQCSSSINGNNVKLGIYPLTEAPNAAPQQKLYSYIDTTLKVITNSSKNNKYIEFELVSLLTMSGADIGGNGFIIKTKDDSIGSTVNFNSMEATDHKPYIVFKVGYDCPSFNSFLQNSSGLSESYYIRNNSTGSYLTENKNVMTSTFGDRNKFMLIPRYSDAIHRNAYTIRSVYTGQYYCLSSDGTSVITTDPPTNFDSNYLWDISSELGARYIINLASPNKFLSCSTSSVNTEEITGTNTKWVIDIADFYCRIKNTSSNKYMTVHEGLSYLTDSYDRKVPRVNVYQSEIITKAEFNGQEYLNGQIFRVERFNASVEGTTKTVYRFRPLSSLLGKGCVLHCTLSTNTGNVRKNAKLFKVESGGTSDSQQYFQISSGSGGYYIKTAYTADWDNMVLYATSKDNSTGTNTGITESSQGNIFFTGYATSNNYNQLWSFEEDNTFLNQVAYYSKMNFGSPINGVSLTDNFNISDDYGPRELKGAYSIHRGLDFAYDANTILKAPVNGVVVDANSDENKKYFDKRGYYVTIETNFYKYNTNEKIYVVYFHMKEETPLSINDTVSIGDVVGKIGSTGPVTGPHLHYAVTTNTNGNSIEITNTINPQFFYYNCNMILQ